MSLLRLCIHLHVHCLYYDEEFAYLLYGCDYCSCHCYCFCLIVFTYMYMYQLYRTHAGIDEMDIFFNIDLNNFLDVSTVLAR